MKLLLKKHLQHYNAWNLCIHSTFILKQLIKNTKEYSKKSILPDVLLLGTREQYMKQPLFSMILNWLLAAYVTIMKKKINNKKYTT